MKQNRILPLLGPATVLYLAAETASRGDGLDARSGLVAALSLGLSFVPLWLGRRGDQRGRRRAALLATATAVALMARAEVDVPSLTLRLAATLALPLTGALIADLALACPDRLRALKNLRVVLPILGLGSALAGVAALVPPFDWLGQEWIFPARLALLPPSFALLATGFALTLRLARARLGSSPEALASNAWALMGLIPATGVGVASWLLTGAALDRPTIQAALLTTGAVSVVYGHVALVDPSRRLGAGRAARRLGTFGATLALLAAGARALPELPQDRLGLWMLWVLGLGLAAVLERVLSPLTERLLAPFGGRLLRATTIDAAELGAATSLVDLGQALLPRLREASGSIDASPLLYVVDPALEVRIDAAAVAHEGARPMPAALATWLAEHPGEPVITNEFLGLKVRRPDLRELIEALTSLDALVVVPLSTERDLEGALVVPRGSRRSNLSLEEQRALTRLATLTVGAAARIAAARRAEARAGELAREKARLQEGIAALEEERERMREESRALLAGRGASRKAAPSIAYSPAMRALQEQLERAGERPGCVHLVAEAGVPVDKLAAQIHQHSPRAAGPLLVVDCAAARPEAALPTLLGDTDALGWLRLARGGTLLLADVPALGLEAEHALDEALAKKKARPVGGRGSYEVDVRVISTSRVALAELTEAGTFDPKLARRLRATELVAPPLRERKDDLPSLTLLALDRAARLLGKAPVGITDAAMEVLVKYDWPGNLRELTYVIDRAVACAQGQKVRREDLPPLAGLEPAAAPPVTLEGSFAEIERRVLAEALERAGGNKSEAARALDLKRTTFLDKLRRHGI